jgi:hypothetical protein
MSEGGGEAELRATVEVDYGQWYLFDPETMTDDISGLVLDPVTQAEVWERKCGTNGGAAMVYANKHDGPIEVAVRSSRAEPDLDEAADHVAECSVTTSSGRLAVSGWESTNLGGEIAVPRGPLRVRISWYGLVPDAGYDDWERERFEVVVFPGPIQSVEVLRWWPPWMPPPAETTAPGGLRRFAGVEAARARASLEPLNRSFDPSPRHEGIAVTSLWRDPADGSHWAHGTGDGSQVLVELSDEAFTSLEAESYEPVTTHARDADGRIWQSYMRPVERASVLLLIQPERWQALQAFLPPDQIHLVELPDGWTRITRRALDGSGGLALVDAVVNEGADGYYQRWRDGTEIPA